MFSYSLSSVLTPLLAMYLTSWHWLLIMATLPNLIVLIAHFGLKLVPESPAWLLCRGRVKEADGIFRKIANVNGVSIDVSIRFRFKNHFHQILQLRKRGSSLCWRGRKLAHRKAIVQMTV